MCGLKRSDGNQIDMKLVINGARIVQTRDKMEREIVEEDPSEILLKNLQRTIVSSTDRSLSRRALVKKVGSGRQPPGGW